MNVFLISGSESTGKILKTDSFHASNASLASKPSLRPLKTISGSASFLPLSELKSSKSTGCPIKSGISLGEVTSHKVKTGFSSTHSGYSTQSALSTSNGAFGFRATARFVFWHRDFANRDKSAESSIGSLGSGLDSFIEIGIPSVRQSQDQHQASLVFLIGSSACGISTPAGHKIEPEEVLRISRLLAEFGPAAEEHCAS